jgi:hypothetical protein
LAQPATGETLAQSVTAACTGLNWAEMQAAFAGNGPEVTACREAAVAAFPVALDLAIADQERLAFSFVELLREPVEANAPAPFPAITYVLTMFFDGWLTTYCTPIGVAPWAEGTLEKCTAAVRMVGIANQAVSTALGPMVVNTLCAVIFSAPQWRAAITGITTELAARGATGTDPIVTVRVDDMATGTAACP